MCLLQLDPVMQLLNQGHQNELLAVCEMRSTLLMAQQEQFERFVIWGEAAVAQRIPTQSDHTVNNRPNQRYLFCLGG
jgi:hypothetical protein